jgi:L-asparaginase
MVEPHLVLLNAGGTISAERGPDGVLRAGGRSLAAALPGLRLPVCEQLVYRGLSEDMTLGDLTRLTYAVHAAVADPDVAGVVVAHGTDTLEESAFLAELTLAGDTPVVFTGAQRAPGAVGFDGTLNLTDALTVAASSEARGLGVLIVFAGRLLAARYARKRRTTAPDAFASTAGDVGRVAGDRMQLFARPLRGRALTFRGLEPDVEVVTAGLGVGGATLDALVARGARGVVLQALGRGNVGGPLAEAVARATAAGCVVLVVSRSDEGGVAPEYETGRRLQEAGALFCGGLDAAKARLTLACLLEDHRASRSSVAEAIWALGFD